MFKFVLSAYNNAIRFLVKKPQIFLLLVVIALVNIPLSFSVARFESNGLNANLIIGLSGIISFTLSVYLYWLAFNSENLTALSLKEWFGKNYLSSLVQYVGGFFTFLPFYTALRLLFGENGLAVKPGHDILMITMSVWFFIVMDLAVLWLCFRNESLLKNVKNSITDVFRNFGKYLILRLLSVAFAYLFQLTFSDFAANTTGLVCGITVLASVLASLSWMSIIFGFLELRKSEPIDLMQGEIQKEGGNAS